MHEWQATITEIFIRSNASANPWIGIVRSYYRKLLTVFNTHYHVQVALRDTIANFEKHRQGKMGNQRTFGAYSKRNRGQETTEHLKATTERVKSFFKFGKIRKSSNSINTVYQTTSKYTQRINCNAVFFCVKLHFSVSCEKVKDSDERKRILLRDRRCFLCIKVGHRGKDCRSQRQPPGNMSKRTSNKKQ